MKIDQCLGNRFPTAFQVPISPVAIATITVPVIPLVFLCLHHAMDFFVHHAADVIPLSHFVQRSHDIEKMAHFDFSFSRTSLL